MHVYLVAYDIYAYFYFGTGMCNLEMYIAYFMVIGLFFIIAYIGF